MDIGRELNVAGDLVARLAMTTRDRDELRRAKRVAVGQRHRVFRTVEGDTWIVGHATVHRHERASTGLRLHRRHPVERHPGAGADRATWLDHDPRTREPFRGARPVEGVVDDVGELGQVEFGIPCDVWDAVPAADVEFVQDDTVPGPDVRHGRDHPADGLAIQRRIGDL